MDEPLIHTAEQLTSFAADVKDYAIFLLDPLGHVVTWNAGAEKIKGYMASEIVGRHFSCFYLPDAIATGWPAHELEIVAKEGRFEDEGWRLRKDGSRFWANVVITAMRDLAGSLCGFLKITRDLTERKQAEERLRQANAELEQRVEERTAELSMKNAALAEANRHKDEFLAILAHELRSPLAPIRTSVQVLKLAGSHNPALHEVGDVIARQTDHMARLITDLLDVSRLTRGLIALRLERLDLARLVRNTCADFRPATQEMGLALTVETPETPVWMEGDKTRLAQVLTNLLDNACKFTESPGKVEIQLTLDAASQKAAIHVCDSGVGIDPELLEHLFEPLRQADRSLHRTKGGLGLGLALVKGLVTLHGGEVEAKSRGRKCGAEFIVRLPIQPEPAVLVPNSKSAVFTGKSKRVLIIEDNRDAAGTLQLLLEVLGHEVRVAYTGLDGVQMAIDWLPNVIFSDIGLPGLDGYGVARELRENQATAATKLIAITGYGSDDDQRRARESGFNYVIIKPAEPSVLMHLLANGA